MSEDADAFLTEPGSLRTPWIRSPFFDAQLEAAAVDPALKERTRRFRDDGYVVFERAVDDALVDEIVGLYPWLFDPATRIDPVEGRPPVLTDDPRRRQDAWVVCPPIRALATRPELLEFLRFAYGRRPIPFQTLNFEFGTEQSAHSDAIHFDTLPSGFMCGAWVALEDMTEENGPLVYYPGSHLLPELQLEHLGAWPAGGAVASGPSYDRYTAYVEAVVRAKGLEARRLTVPRGTILVWDSNLLHGGAPIAVPGRTRMSQVTHYYFEGCVYYSPILSSRPLGEYRLKVIHDVVTGERVPHTLNGAPIEAVPFLEGRDRLVRPGRAPSTLDVWRRRAFGRAERFLRKRRLDRLAASARRLGGDDA